MFVPPFITFTVAACVIAFGCYRLFLAFTVDAETLAKRKGLYGMSKSRHTFYGILYLVLGAMLIAGALGYPLFRIG